MVPIDERLYYILIFNNNNNKYNVYTEIQSLRASVRPVGRRRRRRSRGIGRFSTNADGDLRTTITIIRHLLYDNV